MQVASATVYYTGAEPEMARSNARLIAAAPALLQSLQWVVGRQDTPDMVERHWDALEQARQVLKSLE